jgi:hypothetical protein
MSISKNSNKQTFFYTLGFSILCAILQLIFVLTINTYFLYLVGIFLLTFPIGLLGSLSTRFAKIINDITSDDSQKNEYKIIMYVALYNFLLGLLLYVFSQLIFDINLGMGGGQYITGTVLSIIVMIGSLLTSAYYGIKYLISK